MKRFWVKAIAALEILGGITGPIYLAFQLRDAPCPTSVVVLAVVLLAMYGLALVAGLMLWRNHRRGKALSVAVQLLQLPKIASTTLAFSISFGFDFAPMVVATNGSAGYAITFLIRFGAEHTFYIDNPAMPLGFGISLVSCLFLTLLLKRPKADSGDER
jgi:hypothetical protein